MNFFAENKISSKNVPFLKMATSIDLDFCGSNSTKGCLSASRRHSWPEADLCFLRPCTSGIFEPLPDQEEVELRSSMTSRNSNYSTSSRSRSTRSCNLGFFGICLAILSLELYMYI